MEARYEVGYKAHPENTDGLESVLKASGRVMGKEKW